MKRIRISVNYTPSTTWYRRNRAMEKLGWVKKGSLVWTPF